MSFSRNLWPSLTPRFGHGEKFILVFFSALNVSHWSSGAANGRVCSRTVRRCSCLRCPYFSPGANGRVRSRLVAIIRDCSHLVYIGDVAVHGVWCDEVFFAGHGLDLVAIELCKCAVFLNGARCPGMAGLGIQLCGLLNGEGILSGPANGLGWTRQFASVRHSLP